MVARKLKRNGAHVVVLGGGNGTSRLLRSLLPLLQEKEISSLHALVHMADDGGSTGKLRKQYAVGSMGDLTKCLVALSSLQGDVRGEELLQALDYRFTSGDFAGHTLRNILLTVFELTSHDIDSAIAILARLVQVPKYAGVVPITLKAVTQQVVAGSAVLGKGEHFIAHSVDTQADPSWKPGDVRVTFQENVDMNPRAKEVLDAATHIVIAPGHTYGTILPALALPALGKHMAAGSAKLIVVMTLLTTPKQTTGWSGEDFVHVYESYLGRSIDTVIANTGRVDLELVGGQDWVTFQYKNHPYKLIQADIVSTQIQRSQQGDSVPRAIVVHDADKVRSVWERVLEGNQ